MKIKEKSIVYYQHIQILKVTLQKYVHTCRLTSLVRLIVWIVEFIDSKETPLL